jgi:hypothetical protein
LDQRKRRNMSGNAAALFSAAIRGAPLMPQNRSGAFRSGQRAMARFVKDVARKVQTRLIDQDGAAADFRVRKEGLVRQGRGANLDADAAHERNQPFGQRIGESFTRHGNYAAFASASLALA